MSEPRNERLIRYEYEKRIADLLKIIADQAEVMKNWTRISNDGK